MEEKKIFSDYVNDIRRKKGISMQSLCEGLCTVQDIYYMENDSRKLDILLQEAILERLGVGAEDYEHFLIYEEYERWEKRHHILHSITFEQFGEAGRMLDDYYRTYVDTKDKNKLERQFYLSMLAQIRCCQGECREELSRILDEAVCLTVPMHGEKPVAGRVLSIKELNLMLEAERYRKEGERWERYKEIADYIEKAELDSKGKVKIYPKVMYFLCRSMMDKNMTDRDLDDNDVKKLLKYCNSALEVLRNNGRMYYLWEIISMKEILLEKYIENLTYREDGDKEKSKIDILKNIYRKNKGWRQVLEKVYREFKVPKETFEYCYLYVCKGVSCINDVIRIRREMLGISQRELCEGICDIKTLRRLESRKTSPHRAIVRDLFERLGLSRELSRTELDTSSQEAKELMEKMRDLGNDRQAGEVERLLLELKKMVSMNIPSNRQAVIRKEVFLKWERKEISNGEYYKQMKNALELTLPYEAFMKEGEKYLTNEEQSCIQNMMKVMEKNSGELLICINRFEEMYQFFVENGLQETISGMYEFVMGQIGSVLGNMGKHDEADIYNRQIIEGCLRFKRLRAIQDGLYDRWWNYSERKKKGISTDRMLDDLQELTACLLISRLGKLKYSEYFYTQKIKRMEKK